MTFGPWRRLVVVWIAFIRRNAPRGASALFYLTRVCIISSRKSNVLDTDNIEIRLAT